MIDTKLLRQKILDLAIQGKLVPQNPNDEPASVLLEKIRNEKAALVKAGKIKAPKHSSFIFRGEDNRHYENIDGKVTDITDQIPFDVPQGWEWCRLGNVTPDFQYGTSEKSSSKGLIAVLRMGNLNAGEIDYSDLVYSSNQSEIEKYLLSNGDLLFNRTNSAEHVGKVSIYRGTYPAIFAGYLVRFSPLLLCHDYVNYAMNSSWEHEYCQRVKSDAVNQSNVNAQKLANFMLPVPPLPEQQRIVSCIEQLFALCDTINKADENLESTVSLARQKVLDLAIRGQLVPQNPDDEPASELLKRIQAEKAAQVKAGKRKADKRESTITRGGDNRYYENVNGKITDITDQIPFEIPSSWEWCRLSDITAFLHRGKSPQYADEKQFPIFAQKCNQNDGIHMEKALFCSPSQYLTFPIDYHLCDGDVVINSTGTGTLGRVGIFYTRYLGDFESTVPDSHVTIVRAYMPYVLGEFLFLCFRSSFYQKAMLENADGSTNQKELYTKVLEDFLLPLPPLEAQKRIVDSTKEHIELLDILK